MTLHEASLLCPGYLFPLPWLTALVVEGLAALGGGLEEKAKSPAELRGVVDHISTTVLEKISKGLFSWHRLVFAFSLSCRAARTETALQLAQPGIAVSKEEWACFGGELSEPWALDAAKTSSLAPGLQPRPLWLSARSEAACQHLSEALPGIFGSLLEDVAARSSEWERFSQDPCNSSLGPSWSHLSPFQEVLLLRALGSAALPASMDRMCMQVLGPMYSQDTPFTIEAAFSDSRSASPTLLLSAKGVDPTHMVLDYAKQRGFLPRTKVVSLGKGSTPLLPEMLANAARAGDWLLLQNCHMDPHALFALSDILLSLRSGALKAIPHVSALADI